MRCISGALVDTPLLVLLLVLCASTLASCDGVYQEHVSPTPPKSPSPSPPVCKIVPDYSSTEGELRTTIFDADTKEAAKILSRNETFGLGEGLRYLEEQTCAIVRTKNRRRDPDIVAIQAIALSAKYYGGTEKLANAIVISFEKECQCSLFDSTERDRMAGAFRQILEDPKMIQYILDFGGPVERSTSHYSSSGSSSTYVYTYTSTSGGRRLESTESSPTESFVCAHCDPPNACNGVVNWCPPGRQG